MLPAPAQGAVGIETLAENASIRHLLAVIDDSDTSDCVRSERAFLLGLGAGCHSPVAALARIEDEGIFLKAEILSRSEEHTSELQSLMRISYAVFCLKKKKKKKICRDCIE